MLSLLTAMASNQDEEIIIRLKSTSPGKFRVLITPHLGEAGSNASDSEVALREALALPLVIAGSMRDIEEGIKEHLPALERIRKPRSGHIR